MNYTENIKKRIIFVILAIVAYIFLPIPIGLSMFSFFHPTSFPIAGYVVHAIQVFVFVILIYGALAWVKPSLVPQYISKKIIVGVICAIIILAVLPGGLWPLEPVGLCIISNKSQGGNSMSTNGQSTEQQCIDGCLQAENANNEFNQISCEFDGVSTSWSKTPEELQGYKPNL